MSSYGWWWSLGSHVSQESLVFPDVNLTLAHVICDGVDKRNLVSLKYWFNCVDLNGDGIITRDEMALFFQCQMDRMDADGLVVSFENIMCQLCDLITPAEEGMFTLRDLKTKKVLSHVFFDALFNLPKLLAFDERPRKFQMLESTQTYV